MGVGRLGIITEVELMILPQANVSRTGVDLTFPDMVRQIKELQANWTGALAGTNRMTVPEVLDPWEGTQVSHRLFAFKNLSHALTHAQISQSSPTEGQLESVDENSNMWESGPLHQF